MNQLSALIQFRGLGRIRTDGHYPRILDRAIYLGFIIHETEHGIIVIDPADAAGSTKSSKAVGAHSRAHCSELVAQLIRGLYRAIWVRIKLGVMPDLYLAAGQVVIQVRHDRRERN